MFNNPFRSEPSVNSQENVEKWGQSKFKPKKIGDGVSHDFKKHPYNNKSLNREFNNSGEHNFAKNNKSCKFDVGSRDAKPENATPWRKFKDEIISQQRVKPSSQDVSMDSSEAKTVLKQREINYRKSLIIQKKEEPTIWENFGDEEDNQKTQKSKLNTISKPHFKRKAPNLEREIISQELLNNFDSKKLNYKQNDTLRSAITKTTLLSKNYSLERIVDDMKRKKLKKRI